MEEPFYWARPGLNIKECNKLHNSSPSLAKLDWHLPFQLSLPRILCSPWEVWLANCYFAHNSLRFPALLPFFNASSRSPFDPFNRRPDPVVPTWRPFPRCRVPSARTPAPDRKSLPATIAQSILVGPRPCRLDGALDPSYSSSPCRVVLKPSTLLALHKAMSKRKYRMLFSPNGHRKRGPKGPSAELIYLVVEMKQRNPNKSPLHSLATTLSRPLPDAGSRLIDQRLALAAVFDRPRRHSKKSFAGSPIATRFPDPIASLPPGAFRK
jgi:hypothetical protein